MTQESQIDAGRDERGQLTIVSMVLPLVSLSVALFLFIAYHTSSNIYSLLSAAAFLILGAQMLQRTARKIRESGWFPQRWIGLLTAFISLFSFTVAALLVSLNGSSEGNADNNEIVDATSDGTVVAFVCVGFMSLGILLSQVREDRTLRQATIPLSVGFAECVLMVLASVFWWDHLGRAALWILVIALLISPIFLTLLTEIVLKSVASTDRPIFVFAVLGMIFVVSSLLFLNFRDNVSLTLLLTAGVLVFVLLLSISSSTQADVVLVAIVAALIWALQPSDVVVDEAVVEWSEEMEPMASERVYAALGDSYMSGEGARNFYAGTNSFGTNECRRAETAYARLILDSEAGKALASKVAFFACSGALGEHVSSVPQLPSATTAQSARLADLLDTGADVPLVIVSIGGNDAGFSKIGIECLAPGDCATRGQKWLDQLVHVSTELDSAYSALRKVAGDSVPIVAVPYPRPLNVTRECGYSSFTLAERVFIDGFLTELNLVVERSAARNGLLYLNEMENALVDGDLRICDTDDPDKAGINVFAANAKSGRIEQSTNPANWFHNSLHPNLAGHEALGEVFERWLRDNPNPASPTPTSEVSGEPRSLPEVMLASLPPDYCGKENSAIPDCGKESNDWAVSQSISVLQSYFLPISILVAGCWMLSVALVGAYRWIRAKSAGAASG